MIELSNHTDGLGRNRRILCCFLVVYLAALAWIVFSPAQDASRVTGIVAVISNAMVVLGIDAGLSYSVLEFCANVALFVPFGLLVTLLWRSATLRIVVALALSASATIELIQLTIPSRFSTLSDIVANTAGALVGALIARWLHHRVSGRRPSPS